MPPFHLRLAQEQDYAGLTTLWVETWRETFPEIDFCARQAWLLKHFDTMAGGGGLILLAEDDAHHLLGVATIDPQRNTLEQLAVAPEAKGKGIAKALLAEAKRSCAGPLQLDVNQDNGRALRFYEREGFVKIADGVNATSGRKIWTLRFAGTKD